MIKLKPCPFCGGKARVSFRDVKFGGQNYDGDRKIKYRIQVICNKCRSRGKPITTEWIINPNPHAFQLWNVPEWDCPAKRQYDAFAPYIEKAGAAWNTRAANTSVWEVYHNEDGAFIGFGTCESIHVTDEWHATKEAAEAAKERLEKTGGHCFYYVAERKAGAE